MQALVQHLREQNRSLPENYVCFDCETTGLSRKYDLPIEIGHAVIKHRVSKPPKSHLLDWTRCADFVDQGWLADALDRQAQFAADRGEDYAFSISRLRKEGHHPAAVLSYYLRLFRRAGQRGWGFVGHNAVAFDAELLSAVFENVLDEVFYFGADALFDTGCLHKAAALGLMPKSGETLAEFFRRVKYTSAPGLKWNIRVCAELYLPVEEIKSDMFHQAGYDAQLCHRLLEAYRSTLDG